MQGKEPPEATSTAEAKKGPVREYLARYVSAEIEQDLANCLVRNEEEKTLIKQVVKALKMKD